MSDKGNGRRSSIGYVLEAAASAFIYFLLGGSRCAALWAAFAVVAVWIVVMNA
jgi:O-antigen ligase